ncbi:hypothetical protein FKM82_012380 [Ascaphus truei]
MKIKNKFKVNKLPLLEAISNWGVKKKLIILLLVNLFPVLGVCVVAGREQDNRVGTKLSHSFSSSIYDQGWAESRQQLDELGACSSSLG